MPLRSVSGSWSLPTVFLRTVIKFIWIPFMHYTTVYQSSSRLLKIVLITKACVSSLDARLGPPIRKVVLIASLSLCVSQSQQPVRKHVFFWSPHRKICRFNWNYWFRLILSKCIRSLIFGPSNRFIFFSAFNYLISSLLLGLSVLCFCFFVSSKFKTTKLSNLSPRSFKTNFN